jgi:tetratricopeptide (TPR) repeat protein
VTIERIAQIAVVTVAGALAACSGGGERPPAVVGEARELSADGREAYAEGRLDEAAAAYGRALELHRSIDDPVGITRALLNLAVVRNTAGQPGDAAECLAAIDRYAATLAGAPESRSPEFNEVLAEAAWLHAYLHAAAGRTAAAWSELARARATPGGAGRKLAGRCGNLEARLLLDDGRPDAALAAARRALPANRRAGDAAECADSHRFIGRAALAAGDPAAALDAFGAALAADRDLARPGKVADDLLGMSAAARALGRPDLAGAYAERARLAARAAGDTVREVRARNQL